MLLLEKFLYFINQLIQLPNTINSRITLSPLLYGWILVQYVYESECVNIYLYMNVLYIILCGVLMC